MIHLGSLLLVDGDDARGGALLARLRGFGYEADLVGGMDEALRRARSDHPDALLIGPGLARGAPLELIAALRASPDTSAIPLAAIVERRAADFESAAVAAGADDVLAMPIGDAKLKARVRPLTRLATMHAELRLRGEAAARFGVAPSTTLPSGSTVADHPVLFVGPRDGELREALPGARVTHVVDPYLADEALSREFFDLAVLAPADEVTPFLDLCVQIRSNPSLFNLPVVLIAPDSSLGEELAYARGVNTLFARPLAPGELATRARSLIRGQRLRWAIRSALAETLRTTSRDAETGVYTRAFLDSYLPDRFAFAKRHDRHLSLVFVRVPDIEGVRRRHGETQAQHLRLQIAQWIGNLKRVEDPCGRYAANEFCVVLPDTPLVEAELVTHRIAGVLAFTEFAVPDVYQAIKVWVRVGPADVETGDDLAGLIARARAGVD